MSIMIRNVWTPDQVRGDSAVKIRAPTVMEVANANVNHSVLAARSITVAAPIYPV
jgi:hypothetical protein